MTEKPGKEGKEIGGLVMKALILDGFEKNSKTGHSIADNLVSVLEEMDFEAKIVHLAEREIVHCIGCFGCWIKTPGTCVIDDYGRKIPSFIMDSSLVIYITPITFGGYSSILKKAVDRTIPLLLPFFKKIDGVTHHEPRYKRYPSFLAVGVENHSGDEKIFRELVSRNAVNMHSPSRACHVIREGDQATELPEILKETIRGLEVSE